MAWEVIFHPAFAGEYRDFTHGVRDELAALLINLREFGPSLRRPHADTLEGSKHANMKELRFSADGGVWRAAFAFDPRRRAIILVAADKAGVSQARFYKRLISLADRRLDEHLASLEVRR